MLLTYILQEIIAYNNKKYFDKLLKRLKNYVIIWNVHVLSIFLQKEGEIMTMENKIDQILKIVTKNQEDLIELKERVTKIEERMTALEERMTKLEERVTALE